MMKAVSSIILCLAQAGVFSLPPTSQPATTQVAVEKRSDAVHKTVASHDDEQPAAPRIAQLLPFKVGESLQYEISFEKLIFSGTIGDLKLTVNKAEAPKSNLLAFKAEMVSKGFFPA